MKGYRKFEAILESLLCIGCLGLDAKIVFMYLADTKNVATYFTAGMIIFLLACLFGAACEKDSERWEKMYGNKRDSD